MKIFITPILLLAGLLSFSITRAQVFVNGENINADTTIQLMEVVHTSHPYLFFVEAVDTGKRLPEKQKFTDANGKRIEFKTGISLIDHMKKNGWVMLRREIVILPNRTGFDRTFFFIMFEKAH